MNEKRFLRVTLKLHAKRLLFQNLRFCIAAVFLSSSLTLLCNLLAQRFLPDIRILETTLDLTPYFPQLLTYYCILFAAFFLSSPLTMGLYAWLSELSMNRRPKVKEIFTWLGDFRLACKAYGTMLWFAGVCLFQAVIHLALPMGLMYFISKRVEEMGVQGAVFLVGILTLLLIVGTVMTLLRVLTCLPAQFLLAAHPEMRIRDAYAQCRRIMAGRTGEFFWLVLSFIGWFYLESVSGGLLGFFVRPYFSLAILCFTQEAHARWCYQMGRHTPDPVWTPDPEEREDSDV